MVLRLGINYPVFTLNEKTTISDPNYVLVCKNYFTKKQTACKLGLDLSGYTDRYNQFLLTVLDDPEPLDSEIALEEFGFYKYFIYEIADIDDFDFDTVDTLDLETMTGLVEMGKLELISIPAEKSNYANTTNSMKIYGS